MCLMRASFLREGGCLIKESRGCPDTQNPVLSEGTFVNEGKCLIRVSF